MLLNDLYTIKNQTNTNPTQEEFRIGINKDHAIFKGHFPGNPVMPGVCMIQIIKELTELSIDKSLFLESSSNIKFMAKINPEVSAELRLVIDYNEDEGYIKVKNSTFFEDTLALKLNGTFKILS